MKVGENIKQGTVGNCLGFKLCNGGARIQFSQFEHAKVSADSRRNCYCSQNRHSAQNSYHTIDGPGNSDAARIHTKGCHA